jgi:hypothetical protein
MIENYDDHEPIPALSWADIGWANRGWIEPPPTDALIGESAEQYVKRKGTWLPGMRLHLCNLGWIHGELKEDARQEIFAFAYHLRDHRKQSVEGCRFCAERKSRAGSGDKAS